MLASVSQDALAMCWEMKRPLREAHTEMKDQTQKQVLGRCDRQGGLSQYRLRRSGSESSPSPSKSGDRECSWPSEVTQLTSAEAGQRSP